MDQPYVISLILNTNRREDTLACLETLERSTYPNHKAIVLDNASSDGSVEAIRQAFPRVQIMELAENRGYTGNNNVGIRAALEQGADWVFVLNEDITLDPDCITLLVADGQDDPRIGILGPMVYHFDEPDVIQSAGGRLTRRFQATHLAQNEKDRGQYSHPHLVDWVSGCAILVRRAAIEQIGLLDERFFYYWEETEWCLRAKEAGWHILHVPQAKIWHKGVQRAYKPSPTVTYYATRNWLMLLAKHHAPLGAWIYVWREILRPLTSWTVKPQWRHMRAHRDARWRGTLDFLRKRWGPMSS